MPEVSTALHHLLVDRQTNGEAELSVTSDSQQQSESSNVVYVKCSRCKGKFDTVQVYQSHMCGWTGKARRSLRYLVCHICSKVVRNLTEHVVAHTTEALHKCDICGKALKNKAYMEIHKRIHTGFKPYACSECSLSFRTASGLRKHKIIHSSVKPFQCDVCGKSFKTRDYWKTHSEIHSGKRAYVCKICGRDFVQDAAVRSHMKIAHSTGPKPARDYPCRICGKSFPNSHSMYNHLAGSFGENIYVQDMWKGV